MVETSAGFVLLFLKAGSASWELVEGMHRACVPRQNQRPSSDFGWSSSSRGFYIPSSFWILKNNYSLVLSSDRPRFRQRHPST